MKNKMSILNRVEVPLIRQSICDGVAVLIPLIQWTEQIEFTSGKNVLFFYLLYYNTKLKISNSESERVDVL